MYPISIILEETQKFILATGSLHISLNRFEQNISNCILYLVTKHCEPLSGRCFWLSQWDAGSWKEGREACQSEGGDLAVMETEQLLEYIIANVAYVDVIDCGPLTHKIDILVITLIAVWIDDQNYTIRKHTNDYLYLLK